MGDPEISIIIPTLDEHDTLGRLLGDIARQEDVVLDVVVVDGGSTDGTTQLASELGATVLSAERGRARQMNAGRDIATAPLLLFLHADSRLCEPTTLRRAADTMGSIRDGEGWRIAGHFSLEFDDVPPDADRFFDFLEAKARLNRRHTTHGDQGFMLWKKFFDELGGFDEDLAFLEDERLSERISSRGTWITLPDTIRTSARRFRAEGLAERYFVMAVIMAVWKSGATEFFELAPNLYRDQRHADRLDIEPVFEALDETMRRLGPRGSARAWLEVGRYVCENAWQPFFAIDVARGHAADAPCLELYDDWIAPMLDNDVVAALAGTAAFAVVMGVVPRVLGRGKLLSA